LSQFGLVELLGSCSSDKNSLTKYYVLDYLKQKEVEQSIVFKNRISTALFIKSKADLNSINNYYKGLYSEGYLNAVLRTDIPNPTISNRPYHVILTA
jgi:hypothetical protein